MPWKNPEKVFQKLTPLVPLSFEKERREIFKSLIIP